MSWFVVVALMGLSGCFLFPSAQQQQDAARVRALDPRPLIDLPDSKHGMRLEIDPAVRDQFLIAEQNGTTAVPVEAWHTTLQNGFKNGPARFFKGDPAGPKAWKLVIISAELDFVPTAVFTRGAQVVGAASVQARVRYVARVVAADGKVLLRDQGEVLSTNQWTQAGGSSTTAAEAIAAMYQAIAKQMATL
ncbi:MAG: hypothetical protein JNJ46_09705 [Myxococcales bacterium]|nr:hypothetical protein [Myxococcales bacterium]